MKDRYWHASEVPEALEDWVNENVVAAIKDCWEGDKPVCWVGSEDGRLLLTVAGPEKPSAPGISDCYTVKFDLMAELQEYGDPYGKDGPRSDAQRDDMRERAQVLRKLAADVAALADIADAKAA